MSLPWIWDGGRAVTKLGKGRLSLVLLLSEDGAHPLGLSCPMSEKQPKEAGRRASLHSFNMLGSLPLGITGLYFLHSRKEKVDYF